MTASLGRSDSEYHSSTSARVPVHIYMSTRPVYTGMALMDFFNANVCIYILYTDQFIPRALVVTSCSICLPIIMGQRVGLSDVARTGL